MFPRLLRLLATVVAPIVVISMALRRYDIGSSYRVALIATTGVALLAGLWSGATSAERVAEWRSRTATMPLFVGPVAGKATWASIVALVVTFSVWCIAVGERLAEMVTAFGVLVGLFAASAAWGFWWATVFRSARMGALFAAMVWTPFVTAFLWVPLLVAPRRFLLELALNAHPAAGVLASLRAQKILWSSGIYERLPYAEYDVGFWKPQAYIAIWLGIASFLGFSSFVLWGWRRK